MRKKSLLKRWKWLACAAAGLALLFACPLTANAAVAGLSGSGTEADPYQISTAEDLCQLATTVNTGYRNKDDHFILTNDIDLQNVEWKGIGTGNNNRFQGTFDGKDHTIRNLKGDQGLFGWNDGVIRDLTLENADLTVDMKEMAMGLVVCENGYNGGSGAAVTNVKVKGRIEASGLMGRYGLGAIAGVNYSGNTLTDCSNYAEIIVNGNIGNVGGIVGRSETTLNHCFNYGNITCEGGGSNVGGIIGLTDQQERGVQDRVMNSGNMGNITADGDCVGGIYGRLTSKSQNDYAKMITNCFNQGDIKGKNSVGGIAGVCENWCVASNCYNAGEITVTEGENRGSITGYAHAGFVRNCFTVKGTTDAALCAGGGTIQGPYGDDDKMYVQSCELIMDRLNSTRNGYDRWYYAEGEEDYKAPTFTPSADLTFKAEGRDEEGSKLPAHGKLIDKSGAEQDEVNVVFNSDRMISEVQPGVAPEEGWVFTGWVDYRGRNYPEKMNPEPAHSYKTYARWCQHDAEHLDKVRGKEATCEKTGYETYWECPKCGWLFSDANGTTRIDEPVIIAALGHDYDIPEWEWNGFESARAVFTCKRNESHVRVITCDKINLETTQATCVNSGKNTYTAAVFLDEEGPYTDTMVQALPKADHIWGGPSYTWEEDHSCVIAKRICKTDPSHIDVEISGESTREITKEPTCEEKGEAVYTAGFVSPVFEEQSVAVEIPAKGHAWDEWKVTKEATATENGEMTRVCRNDPAHTETREITWGPHEHALTHSPKVEPKCDEPGYEEYWQCIDCAAIFADDEGKVRITAPEQIPALGHDLQTEWGWNEDMTSAQLKLTCSRCDFSKKPDAEVFSSGTAATCETAGQMTYTALVRFDGKTYKDVQVKDAPALGHDYGVWKPFSDTEHQAVCRHDDSHIKKENHEWLTEIQMGKMIMTCGVCGAKMTIPTDLTGAAVVLSNDAFIYNGKEQKPEIKTISRVSLKEGTDYTVQWPKASTDAGTYTITINGAGDFSGETTATYTINKAANTLKVKAKAPKLKAKKLKKKKQTIALKKAIAVSKAQGAVTYTKVKVNKKKFAKKFTINKKTGKITVKKGVKKGTYKMTIKVTAAGNKNYKPISSNVVVKIKIK